MKYIGKGPLGAVLSKQTWCGGASGLLVWGRRARSLTSSDLRAVHGRDVLYLDTIDVASCTSAWVRLRWLINLYRIEKSVVYYFLRIVARRVHRVHVTAIVDSAVWKGLTEADDAKGVRVKGFTYEGLAHLLGELASSGTLGMRCRARDLYRFADVLGTDVVYVNVRQDAFDSKLLRSVSCPE